MNVLKYQLHGEIRRQRHPSKATLTNASELHRLCRSGDLSAIKSYLNEVITRNVINQVAGENGCTPLHEAAMAGREDVVRLLKEECQETINMDARTQHGPASTPLHLAAERGHTECVLTLLECGATIGVVDRRCRNAKDVAKENGKRQVVQVITLVGKYTAQLFSLKFAVRLECLHLPCFDVCICIVCDE